MPPLPPRRPAPDPRALLAAAEGALRAGRAEEACRATREALRAAPDDPAIQHDAGALLLRAGRPADALGPLARATRGEAAPVGWILTLAGAQAVAGQAERAEASFRRALAREPAHPVALLNLGILLTGRGALAEAREALQASLAARPGHPGALLALGNVLSRAREREAAAEAFRGAIAARPDFAEAHSNLGGILADLGEAAEAEGALRRALSLNPRLAIAWVRLGDLLLAAGRATEAEEALRRALAVDPRLAEASHGLGRTLMRQRREGEALAAFRAAVAARPELAEAQADLAMLLAWLGEAAEALAAAKRALAARPDAAPAHFAAALAAAARGDLAAAAAASRQALRHQPFVHHPARGEGAVTVLILLALGEGYFEPSRNGPKLIHGHNNAAEHLDPDRFGRVELFVDALEEDPGLLDRLPRCDVVYNAITEPERMGPGLALAEMAVRRLGLPVVNPPELIPRAARDLAPELFAGIDGLLVPRLARVPAAEDTAAAVRAAMETDGLRLPLIARPAGTHTGQGMVLLREAADLAALPPRTALFLTEFVDFQDADGVWRKTRIMVVDGTAIPEHLAAADHWNIHHGNSRAFMRAHPEAQEEERAYLAEFGQRLGPLRLAAVREMARRLGLDFFGIDGALLADGRLLVFEANPSMRAMFAEAREGFDYLLPGIGRVSTAFADLVLRRAGRA
jgi:tetratricopeptide (TPR) repeat protein